MPAPDFYGIGAQKAGTTWLHQNLEAHPGIWMPQEKELHYFDIKNSTDRQWPNLIGSDETKRRWRRQFKRQIRRWRRNRAKVDMGWNARYFLRKRSDDWYRSLFEPEPGQLCGDITPAYAMLTKPRIRQAAGINPNAKAFMMVRDPIERSWSATMMNVRRWDRNPETWPQMQQFLTGERPMRLSKYLETLEPWARFLGRDQLYVGFLEDVARAPETLLTDIYGFLGVEIPDEMPKARQTVNTGRSKRIPAWAVHELANAWIEGTEELAEGLGGYAKFWAFTAKRLASTDPDGPDIEYPFHTSPLWDEFVAQHGPMEPIQSAPFVTLRPRRPRLRPRENPQE